jgi:hypothetical protein
VGYDGTTILHVLEIIGGERIGGEGAQPKERVQGHYNITLHCLIETSCSFFGFIETQHKDI